MKSHLQNQRNQALTLIELLAVLAIIAFLILLILPSLATNYRHSSRIGCVNNLKQVGLTYRVWAGDNNDKYPMDVSVTNGGAMELIATGNVVDTYQCMSNELSTPKILCCPDDHAKTAAITFGITLAASNISYFIGADADQSSPQRLLAGDDNLQLGGVPIKPGLNELSANSDVAWTSARHVIPNAHFWTPDDQRYIGNISFADGSARQVTNIGLQQALQNTTLATNRFAIP